MPEVQLVCMPFAAVERPSIALGTLQSLLAQEKIDASSVYANLEFCQQIGYSAYRFWEDVLGDLVFASAAFPNHRPDLSLHFRKLFARNREGALQAGIAATFGEFEEAALAIRQTAARFVDALAEKIAGGSPRVVGCTSMYWQHTASLALLRRVRALEPSIITIMGGANCEGVMGMATHRNFPWVDYVVSGDADDLIGPLCLELLGREWEPENLPHAVFGPRHRRMNYVFTSKGLATPRAEAKDLNSVPSPNYDDYFQALVRTGMSASVTPGLLIETARGCWYGQVQQCKFCGISEGGMKFNAKSPERVLAEFDHLEQRHGSLGFEVTDNILSMSYFNSVLPRLAERPGRLTVFWETKANLKRPQIRLLAEAGVSWVQPGIESLDSRVLKLMNKGVQASQNIQFLRWCREDGIRVAWNMLWGFPGEDDRWYAETAELIALLHHLQPPRLLLRLRYDRYSVYHSRAEEHGLKLQPLEYMPLAFPLEGSELSDLAYYFEAVGENGKRIEPVSSRPGVLALNSAVMEWKRLFWGGLPPVLSMTDNGDQIRILDTRKCALAQTIFLCNAEREVYLACREMPLRSKIGADAIVDDLKCKRLLAEIDGRLLALATEGEIPRLPPASAFPGGWVKSEKRVSDSKVQAAVYASTK